MTTTNELKKHTSAIHTNGRLTLLEKKLSNVLIYNAYDNLLLTQEHQINVHALAALTGFTSRDTRKLKQSIRKLQSVQVEWDVLSEDNEREWGVSSLLASVRINGGTCTYEISKALSVKLSEPQSFGVINLEIQKTFTSVHALTIYEVCSRFKGLLSKRAHCYTIWYSLEDFRKLLSIDNLEYYSNFKQLNAKIIKPSVNEISGSLKKYAGTDIQIKAEFKKLGKTVTDIRFRIEKNKQTPLALSVDESDEIRNDPLYARLADYGIADKAAIHLLKTHDKEYIEEKLLLTDELSEQQRIKTSAGGYLKRAIEDDYKPPITESAEAKKGRVKQAAKQRQIELLQKQADDLEAMTQQASQRVRRHFIATLDDEAKQELFEVVTKNLPPQMRRLVSGLEHPMIADEVNKTIPRFEEKVAVELAV